MYENKKHGIYKILFSLMLDFYEKNNYFFKTIDEIEFLASPEFLEEMKAIFAQERTLRRYKQEIRTHLKRKLLDSVELDNLKIEFQEKVFEFKNTKEFQEFFKSHLKCASLELPENIENIVSEIFHFAEEGLFLKIRQLLSLSDQEQMNNFLEHEGKDELASLKEPAGKIKHDNCLDELNRLNIINKIDFSKFDFLLKIHHKWLDFYARKFLVETPKRIARKKDADVLLMLYLQKRRQQSIDNIIDYLRKRMSLIKNKGKSYELRIKSSILNKISDIKSLFQVSQLACDYPEHIVTDAIFSKIDREDVIRILGSQNISELSDYIGKAHGVKNYRQKHRSLILKILHALCFSSDNKLFMEALSSIYKGENTKFYEIEDESALLNIISRQKFLNSFEDKDGKKYAYEFEFLKILSAKLHHREIYVHGSLKYKNPKDEYLEDFEQNKKQYFDALKLPLSFEEFAKTLQDDMHFHLSQLDANLKDNKNVTITTKYKKPWIKVTPITAQPEESNFLKQTISSHFGHLNLIDILNEVDIRTEFTKKFITLGSRMVLDQEDKRQKILLCSYALGTNIGLARTSQLSGMSYEGLRHIKRFYFQPDNLREVIKYLSDSALTIYDEELLGKLSKILVSDSKQISSFSDNMVTQWHPRYKRNGVMIYWHLNKNHICIFSQLKNCTSSEVASMLNGILNHKTSLDVEGQCVDTHGQSYIGFALSFLLGFDLLPRIKNIGSATLYVPYDMDLQNIQPIIKDKIKFDLIEPYYDDCVRIVTQLRNGQSDAFSIIRQFSASNYGNPLFKALREIGRAQKTIFLCRYLQSESLRQEINAGLNIVENWNSMIKFVHYAKNIDAPSNNIDDQEVSILTLHLIQLCMTYVNIVMLQNLLKKKLLPKGQYTSSFYNHINPYGDINFSFTKRLNIGD